VPGEGAIRLKHMAPEDSIFEKIALLEVGATLMGVRLPRWQPSVADCVQWLRHEGLTRDGHSLQRDPARDPAGLLDIGNPQVLGISERREYINSEYVSGAAQLLAMLLSSPDPDLASLMLLAKTVMPSGNSAFLQKPDIPTYLVGDSRALARFGELVPEPNEAYTSLFWLGDTSSGDDYLKDRKKKEALAKRNPA